MSVTLVRVPPSEDYFRIILLYILEIMPPQINACCGCGHTIKLLKRTLVWNMTAKEMGRSLYVAKTAQRISKQGTSRKTKTSSS